MMLNNRVTSHLQTKYGQMITYWRRSSAGPPFSTSLTAIDGSPVTKCGLSRPPETAMPERFQKKFSETKHETNEYKRK